MARRYQQKPSEILGIEYKLLAFMIDEFAIYLETELTDDEGVINWDKLNLSNKTLVENNGNNNNEQMMRHIEENRRGPNVTKS